MTPLLSCVVATLALGAEPDLKGLPFGIPPAPEDAVIASIAPPRCLFYCNWAGTASPCADSGSETEKFLAEPEVQELLSGTGTLIAACLNRLDTSIQAAPPGPADANSKAAKPGVNFAAEEYGDFLNVLLTHPTGIFIADVKPHSGASAESTPRATPGFEIEGGMVVSLGSDASRLRGEFTRLLKKAKKENADLGLRRINIRGETWYRAKSESGDISNETTFGFHGRYFIVGVGRGSIKSILNRWSRPAPAWLTDAMARAPFCAARALSFSTPNCCAKHCRCRPTTRPR